MEFQEKEFVSVKTLSRMLDIPEKTIRTWVYKRLVPYRKVGKLVRFNMKEIRAWVNADTISPVKTEIRLKI